MERPARSAEEIRNEMRLTRERASVEITEVVDGARELADWRAYPRKFPWVTLGAAALAGYVAMPTRNNNKLLAVDAATLQEFARQHDHKLILDTGAPTTKQRGMIGALLIAAGTAALRMGATAVSREVARRLQATAFVRTEESAL